MVKRPSSYRPRDRKRTKGVKNSGERTRRAASTACVICRKDPRDAKGRPMTRMPSGFTTKRLCPACRPSYEVDITTGLLVRRK